MNEKRLLTDQIVNRLPFATAGQYKVRDTELVGFMVVVGKRSRTFMVQGEFWRDGVREFSARVKVGEVGDASTRDARRKAKEELGKIAKGQRPGETPQARARSGEVTLREAWERYKEAHLIRKGRGERTIEGYQDHMDSLFADWLDKPLANLGRTPKLVSDRHDKITKENGPYRANGAMRTLRAVYNHAKKSNPNLPGNPVGAVDWNEEARRDTGMGPADLAGWFEELYVLDNPIRREFHLLLLLSGSRPDAFKRAQLEHLNLRQRILHIPKPKGGRKKAFDIPLSRAMVRSIIRVIRLGRIMHPEQAETWLFPAFSAEGHLVEHKEDRADLSKWGNDLRQSYRTLGQAAGLSELDLHLLMNHSLPGVNAGYITRDRLLGNHLRQQQDRLSDFVIQTVPATKDGRPSPVATWLGAYRVDPAAEPASDEVLTEPERLAA